MAIFYVDGIEWDTDGYDIDLPSNALVKSDSKDDVVDALSDHYGYCFFMLVL